MNELVPEESKQVFRDRLAVVAWRSYVRRLLGFWPPKSGHKIPQSQVNRQRVMRRLKCAESEAYRLLEHAEAMRPGHDNRKIKWPGEFDDDKFRVRAFSALHPLRMYRTARGMTAVQLAKRLGIDPSLLFYYETGKSNVPMPRGALICEILEIPFPSFMHAWERWTRYRMRFLEGEDGALVEYWRWIEDGMEG